MPYIVKEGLYFEAVLKAESDLVGFHISHNAGVECGVPWLCFFKCAGSASCVFPFISRFGSEKGALCVLRNLR